MTDSEAASQRWPVTPGGEPFSFVAQAPVGALVLHGFTGSPGSVRGVAEALAAAGFDVESPRLPGHGTAIDDMLNTGWSDWLAEAERAYRTLAERVSRVVVVGQSMGGTLAISLALAHPEIAGVVAINPATRGRGPDFTEMIDDLLADGVLIAPGSGTDVADASAADTSYADTPLEPLRSMIVDGVEPLELRYYEATMPLRLFTSRQDHVVDPADSKHLAGTWGGPVAHTWLERSFHVATLDFDHELIETGTVAFVAQLAGSAS